MQIDPYSEDCVFNSLLLEDDVITDHDFADCRFENCETPCCRFTDCTFCGCRAVQLEFKDTICSFEQCSLVGINWAALVGGDFLSPKQSIF